MPPEMAEKMKERYRESGIPHVVRGNAVQAFGLTGPQLVLIPMILLLAVHFVRQARIGAWQMPPAPRAASRDVGLGPEPDSQWSPT